MLSKETAWENVGETQRHHERAQMWTRKLNTSSWKFTVFTICQFSEMIWARKKSLLRKGKAGAAFGGSGSQVYLIICLSFCLLRLTVFEGSSRAQTHHIVLPSSGAQHWCNKHRLKSSRQMQFTRTAEYENWWPWTRKLITSKRSLKNLWTRRVMTPKAPDPLMCYELERSHEAKLLTLHLAAVVQTTLLYRLLLYCVTVRTEKQLAQMRGKSSDGENASKWIIQ